MKKYNLYSLIAGLSYGFMTKILVDMSPSLFSEDFVDPAKIIGTLSFSFLMLMPFGMGAVTVYFSGRTEPVSYAQQIMMPWFPVTLCMFGSFIFFIEGLICIVLALPLFWLMSSIGGLVMGLFVHWKYSKNTLMSIAILPLLMLPIESSNTFLPQERWVSTSVLIEAKPEEIWSSFLDVQDIKPEELGFSVSNLMGFPRPLHADMRGAGIGSLRVSTWEKGVEFGERITEWNPNISVAWEFEINPEKIPPKALDEHVKLGGKFWTVVKGEYNISEVSMDRSKLELRTLYRNNTSWLLPYAQIWSDFLLDDFQSSILNLIKVRSESL